MLLLEKLTAELSAWRRLGTFVNAIGRQSFDGLLATPPEPIICWEREKRTGRIDLPELLYATHLSPRVPNRKTICSPMTA